MNDPLAGRFERLLEPGQPDWLDVHRRASRRQIASHRRRRRFVLAGGALVAAGIVVGAAIAATGWLIGAPAPQSVKSDFGSYTPQLGFHPQPGKAVLVASAGDDQLYATTNTEGSYCVILSTPTSRPPESMGGGYCIGKATAEQPLVAGLFPVSGETVSLAGRVSVAGAAAVEVQLPGGQTKTIALGSSGFFLGTLDAKPCQYGTWSPRFVAINSEGTTVAASTITVEMSLPAKSKVTDVCDLAFLTSENAQPVNIHPMGQP